VDAEGRLPTCPTFVLPYKRFAAPCLLSRAQQFLEHSRTTYRTSVQQARMLIGYAVDKFGHQPVVDHSLVWRFLGWLGGLTVSLDKARQMILQNNPNSLCHRTSGCVDPHKARSLQRHTTLETARQLLLIIPEWEECFGCKFFPKFATRSGFD